MHDPHYVNSRPSTIVGPKYLNRGVCKLTRAAGTDRYGLGICHISAPRTKPPTSALPIVCRVLPSRRELLPLGYSRTITLKSASSRDGQSNIVFSSSTETNTIITMGSSCYEDTFGPISLSVPPVDLLTYTFEGGKTFDKAKVRLCICFYSLGRARLTTNQKLYFDAEDESRALSAAQVESSVKKVIAGLKSIGVGTGDCVALHLFNSVRQLITS
jgi:hypothetical protein